MPDLVTGKLRFAGHARLAPVTQVGKGVSLTYQANLILREVKGHPFDKSLAFGYIYPKVCFLD